jgi:hypothetical protein
MFISVSKELVAEVTKLLEVFAWSIDSSTSCRLKIYAMYY